MRDVGECYLTSWCCDTVAVIGTWWSKMIEGALLFQFLVIISLDSIKAFI